MPKNTIYVGRPTKWGNPYQVGTDGSPRQVVQLCRRYLARPEQAELVSAIRAKLKGRALACWCPLDKPCHADVLLEIANG